MVTKGLNEDRQEVTPGKQNVMLFAQRTSTDLLSVCSTMTLLGGFASLQGTTFSAQTVLLHRGSNNTYPMSNLSLCCLEYQYHVVCS